eukprot:CAMPEP_0170557550 /NCGR_PEP_ID=MMETSP0211-20121228/27534_1 /TAXON_ID=311385 /ORGANISM="Pseudokeronopsis sp., Strain OXSARD2" /LENGTH=53 /DNA_ID=CAMNT_0010868689 /DNA_START=36 /DNA_END=197 /DNA_ORIENTATION=-
MISVGSSNREQNAEVNLAMAYAINSLFFNLLKLQGKKEVLKEHPVQDQLNLVK